MTPPIECPYCGEAFDGTATFALHKQSPTRCGHPADQGLILVLPEQGMSFWTSGIPAPRVDDGQIHD